jgi:prepilin-type N-terminal cleavage/methylation domain-containing protein
MPATYVQRHPLRTSPPAPRACGARPRHGFTLIEILVVVIILGIAAAVIVPHIGSRSDLKATSAARLMMADLIYVQNRSISQQRMHYVQFDAGTGSYKVLETITAPQVIITHPVEQSPFVVAIGAAGPSALNDVSIDSVSFDGQTVLAFDEMGTPYAHNAGTGVTTALTSGTISLKCRNMLLNIIIEPFTGELRLGPLTPVP